MTKMKKVLSLVLALVMTVSLFSNWPMPAFATEAPDTVIEEVLDVTSSEETVTETPAAEEPVAEPVIEEIAETVEEVTTEPATEEVATEPTEEIVVEETVVEIVAETPAATTVVEETTEEPVQPSLYDKLMAAESVEEFDALIDALSDEELAAYAPTLTEEQNANLLAKEKELMEAETVVPEEEPVETDNRTIGYETVDVTDAAPFLPAVEGALPRLMAFALAREGEAEEDNGLELDKYVTGPDANGQYTLTLEAWATGSQTITSSELSVPTDIILVLDQSGSMGNNFTSIVYNATSERNPATLYNNRNNLYVKRSDNSYAPVTVTRRQVASGQYTSYSGNSNSTYYNNRNNLYHSCGNGTYGKVTVSYDSTWSGRVYTYTCANGCTLGTSTGRNTTPTFNGQFYQPEMVYQYTFTYQALDGTTVTEAVLATGTAPSWDFHISAAGGNTTRLAALKTAVNNFASSVATKAKGKDGVLGTEDDVDHTISVVGFANYSNYNNYGNTEIFIGSNEYKYGSAAQGQYANAPQDMSTAQGVANVTASVNALSASGATYIDLGIEMANGILNANPIPAGEKRNRVVVIFTDGVPGYSGEYGGDSYGSQGDNAQAVADAAMTQIAVTKDTHQATVYTVGIFTGADATSAGSNAYNASDTQKANYFMQRLSSNTAYPQTPSYYLSASDSNALNNIFQTISENIQSGGSSVTLDSEAIVKDVISDQFELPEGADTSSIKVYTADYTAENTFADPVEFTDAEVTLSADNKTVSVSNFDFAENWVGTTTTNGTAAYRGKKLIIEIPIEVRDGFLGGNGVLTNGDGSGVYENAEAEEPFEEFVSPDVDVELADVTVTAPDWNVYLLGSVSADQIEKSLTVKVGDQTLDMNATNYGLASWQTAYVTFEDHRGYSNLTEDQNFTATFTVKPIEEGAATAKSGTDTAVINVFKPEVTFKDVKVYQGTEVPALAGLDETLVWKHGDTLSTDVTMTGAEPELVHTYTPAKTGVITGTEDIAVDVATDIGTTDVTAHVTYADKPVIYVFSPEVTYKDLGVYLGNAVPTADQLAAAVELVEWKNATLGAATADMGTAPELTHAFSYNAVMEYVSTNADIPVNDIIRAGGTDITPLAVKHTDCVDAEERVQGAAFELHVFTPVITFQDSQILLGNTPDYATENFVGVEWVNDVFTGTTIGEVPTPAYEYSPAAAPFTVDTPVKVTVKVGATDITGFVKFYREACGFKYCENTDKTEVSATDANRVNFVVHIKVADLTIVKQAGEGTTFAEDETFMFSVTGPNNYSTTVVIKGADSITIKDLPMAEYTVTELTDWSWRYTADENKKVCNITSENGYTATFTNTLNNRKWLDGSDYIENVFTK